MHVGGERLRGGRERAAVKNIVTLAHQHRRPKVVFSEGGRVSVSLVVE